MENKTKYDEYSWTTEYDGTTEYDEQGRVIARTRAGDPKHVYSYTIERDEQGREIAYTQAGDPKHEYSWTFAFVAGGYDARMRGDGRLEIGCQVHSLEYWMDSWEDVARGNGFDLDEGRKIYAQLDAEGFLKKVARSA